MQRLIERFGRVDWTLSAAAITLTSVGLVALYGISISQTPADLFLFHKQFATFIIGLLLVLGLIFLDYRYLRSYGLVLYIIGAVLLISVLFFGVTVNNTRGWFRLGALSFQPVEIAKITLVIYLSALFSRKSHKKLTWNIFGISFLATLVYAALVLLQPDFGSAMVLFVIWGALALFAGLPKHAWLIIPIAVMGLGGLTWSYALKPYQQARIESFINPELDPRGSGYNAIQARIAVGSGGWFGKGIGEGSQARLRFLPASATDFIFAVIGEELGFFGITFILGLFLLMIYRFIRLGFESEDEFASLMLIGLGSVLLVHMIVNAGMNLGIMPITGIPMPFLSAAASYLLVTFLAVGLAQSVAVRRRGLAHQDTVGTLFE
jgi:rod shape determining protein RodA